MRIIILLIFCSIISSAQPNLPGDNPYSKTIVITAIGGITLGNTDFESSKPGFSGGGSIEYFIQSSTSSIFGIRAHFTGNTVVGKETELLPGFKTDIYSLGTGISYMYSVDNSFFPYAFAGISSVNFTPTVNGSQPPNLRANAYKTSTFAYCFDVGARVLISQNVSLNLTVMYNLPQTDYIDDIEYLNNNDKFLSINAGISFSLLGNGGSDRDNDNIPDKSDPCPNEAEDFDGFEDGDGCPDYDNDKDGIVDINDKCPNHAEDVDGFEDEDGCPDNDNDKDGIFDSLDKCPNLSEDLDGYQDDDGCPDLDNDRDGIMDVNDKCPNTAEDIDGFEDYDGCPEFDNDKDGINDKQDACPNNPETFNGYEDTDGCPDTLPLINEQRQNQNRSPAEGTSPKINTPVIKKPEVTSVKIPDKVVLEEVLIFEDDKAKIKSQAFGELDNIARYMKQNPDAKWRIEGYNDKQPGTNTPSNLGGKRANEVMLYLVKKGVPLNQLEVVDMGDKYPRSDNDKPSGRAQNRRVEIKKGK
jgi:outer membrane protein OmpA-like peptidoglycan-associated protein